MSNHVDDYGTLIFNDSHGRSMEADAIDLSSIGLGIYVDSCGCCSLAVIELDVDDRRALIEWLWANTPPS